MILEISILTVSIHKNKLEILDLLKLQCNLLQKNLKINLLNQIILMVYKK